MAYFSQEKKKAIAPAIKQLCSKYGVKASLAVRHNSTVVLNVKSGKIDFFENSNFKTSEKYIQVNTHWINKHFTGAAEKFLTEAKQILNTGNHNRSDLQSDYFDIGHYVNINIGQWDQPYVLAC